MEFFESVVSRSLSDSDTDGEADLPVAHQAAATGDVVRLAQAVQRDPSMLELQSAEGLTPLAQAVRCQQMAAVKRLVKMGADINAQDALGRTCLCIAAYQGWHEGVVYLLRNGARQNICDKTGRFPLHAATYTKDVKALVALVQMLSTAEINQQDNELMSAVHWAAFHNRPEHLRLLMERGADVASADTDGKMALHWAAQNGSEECCRLLASCEGGERLLCAADHNGKTAVHHSAAAGHAGILRQFVQRPGCDVEVKDPDGRTPLHWAAAMGHAQCVQVLLHVGAKADSKDLDGATPLDYACQSGDAGCVYLLENALSTENSHADSHVTQDSTRNSSARSLWNPLGFFKSLFSARDKSGIHCQQSFQTSGSPPDMPSAELRTASKCEGPDGERGKNYVPHDGTRSRTILHATVRTRRSSVARFFPSLSEGAVCHEDSLSQAQSHAACVSDSSKPGNDVINKEGVISG